VTRHRTLIDAVRTKDRVFMAAAIKEHYLNPRSFHDNDDRG
jgi:DNA-binding GntR family transcriptional regulator